MDQGSELLIPIDYSASVSLVDIYLRRFLLIWLNCCGIDLASSGITVRLIPSACRVLGIRSSLPRLRRSAPVLLGLDDVLSNRLMSTLRYHAWIHAQLRLLIAAGVVPIGTRHLFLRPFLKSFRPEYPLVENLDQIRVFYDLVLPAHSGRRSFSEFVDALSREAFGVAYARTRTGDLSPDVVERLSLDLFRLQRHIVFSFHAKTLRYLPSLSPEFWVAPVSVLGQVPLVGTLPILLEYDSILAYEYVYPSLHFPLLDPASEDAHFDEQDDDEDEEGPWSLGRIGGEIDNPLAEAGFRSVRRPAGSLSSRKLAQALKLTAEISPDFIEPGGMVARIAASRLVEALQGVRWDPSLPLVVVFLPKPPGNALSAVVCSLWSLETPQHDLLISVDEAALRGLEYENPLFVGWGQYYLCRISASADPAKLYAAVTSDPAHLPAGLIDPLLLLARLDGFRFRCSVS